MQIADELTQAVANEAGQDTRPSARGFATRLQSAPKLVFRCVAAIAALGSIVAISLMAIVSFGFYGAAALLGKIPLLREAYQLVSRTYDGLLKRLGQKVLRDPRDTPALRLMVSLTFTAVPIFIIQLLVGKLSLLLALAFYLSLYGLKFRQMVRMFSCKHLEAHRPQGYFSGTYHKIFGRYVEFFLGYLYGDLPELGRTVHVRLHHKENGGPDDTVSTMGYDRTSPLHFFYYLSDNFWTALGVTPYAYFKAKGDEKNQKRMFWGTARYLVYFAAVFIYNWRIGIAFVIVPLLCMNFIMAIAAWVQHAFCDPENPEDTFANTVTVYDDVNFMNEGYHLCHHDRSGMHWTEMPAHLDRLREKMKTAGSLIFRDMDFMELFFELTVLRRMDVLAEKLVPWEPMDHQQRLALLAKRTKPVRAVAA